MKAITQVRRAAHLLAHIEDLQELGEFHEQDVRVIQDALLLLIEHIQRDALKNQVEHPVSLPLSFPAKTYEFYQRMYVPDDILVFAAGLPVRKLKHVPIFAYRFGRSGLPALDAALAVLADFFGEELSMRAFAAGKGQYCFYYRAFAKEILSRGHFETRHIMAFLRRKR